MQINEPDNADFNVHPKDEPILYRHFFGKTDRDIQIENLPVPTKPFFVKVAIKAIRYYQKNISKRLGNRCVFDPSCSHYAEMAFRKKGVLMGTIVITKRLCRCKSSNGGVDELQ